MPNPIASRIAFAVALLSSLTVVGGHIVAADNYRATAGLQALYDFAESDGDVIRDRSETDSPINLKIGDGKAVTRRERSLQVLKSTLIQSEKPPTRLIDSVRSSGELTVEAWLQPANVKQAGPARIVTISKDANERNFTLGQDGNKFEGRLRTTKTSTNGIPSVSTPGNMATTDLTHVVYARSKDGKTRIYVNGKKTVEKPVEGGFSNWDKSYRLALANELNKSRPWLGTLHLVAIYSRALTAKEVNQNFSAGPAGKPSPELIAQKKQREAARHFETAIAPLLAKHCVE